MNSAATHTSTVTRASVATAPGKRELLRGGLASASTSLLLAMVLLLLAAWLCETEQDALFAQLLAWHLLPWSGRFLSVFVDHAAHPFYQALGQLAQATLAQWQENLPIAVAEKALYR